MSVGKPIHVDVIRPCDVCGEGLARQIPLFYRVNIERMAVNAGAVRSIVGLTTILGSQKLAAVLSPDSDVAKPICESDELIICHSCGVEREMSVAELAERAAQRRERDSG